MLEMFAMFGNVQPHSQPHLQQAIFAAMIINMATVISRDHRSGKPEVEGDE